MAMEHKAYLFDTNRFNNELRDIVINSGETNNIELLKTFITNNIGEVCSVYTGELLNDDWEKELENGGVQELADFAMTLYYSPEEELGLSYTWDVVVETLNNMSSTSFHSDYYVLGRSVESDNFTLDPGGMGLGFVYAEDVPEIFNELVKLKASLTNSDLPSSDSVLYQISFSELMEAYEELIQLYKEAREANYGLLMTF